MQTQSQTLEPVDPARVPHRELAGGARMPAIGLGTFGSDRVSGERVAAAVYDAIQLGYRHIDCAAVYGNEHLIGESLERAMAGGIRRDELWITSKLWNDNHEPSRVATALEQSLHDLRLDHLDLYLVHWPNPGVGRYVEAYEALVACRERGLVRHVGVSNFLPDHLDTVIAATGVTPVVNQVELHPYFPQHDQRHADAERGVVTEAWSPIGRAGELLSDPVVTAVAAAHGVSPVQAVLRWHVQLGVVPIPKASSPERQRENLDVFSFELSTHEMNALTGLARADGRTNDQDPAVYEEL
jgi:diketogulonate reductase-like aldo/keto reductase